MTITIRHATLAADRPEDGLGEGEWDAPHIVDGLDGADLRFAASGRLLGRVTPGPGPGEELTPQQVRTALNVAEGATANAADAFLLNRANHTGSQSLDTTTDSPTRLAMTPAERTSLAGVATEVAGARADRQTLGQRIQAIADFASPNVGSVVPGRYYDQSLQASAATTVAGSADRLEMSPFVTSQRMRIDQIGVSVSTLVAGSLLRCFIYDAGTDGWPRNLLFEGSVNLPGDAAVYVAHSLDFTFDNGRKYWIGVRFSANTTVRAIPIASMGNLGIQSAAASAYNTQLRDTLAFATPLPATWTFAEAQLATGNPVSIRMRAVAL